MNLIQNLSIRNKLILISFIPLAVLLYFLADAMLAKNDELEKIQNASDATQEIEAISDLINGIQRERPPAVIYQISNGKEGKSDLIAERLRTDQSINELRNLLKKQGKPDTYGFIDKLPEIRNNILTNFGDPEKAVEPLSKINTLLRGKVDSIRHGIEYEGLSRPMEAHAFLLFAKATLGKLRMVEQLAILSENSGNKYFAAFASFKGAYELSLSRFRNMTYDELANEYEKRMADPQIILAKELIDSVFKHPEGKVTLPEGAWLTSMTTFIEELKELEDISIHNIMKQADLKLYETKASLTVSIIVAVIVVLLIVILLFITIRAIVSAISQIKEAAIRITNGDVDLSVTVNARDEIGDLATSFNRLIQVTKEYSVTAETIGKGDYSPEVRVRSGADLLGVSLNNMKNNLQKLSKENETRTWLLTGNSELNDAMRGEKNLGELAQDIINKLVTYLDAQIGAIYLAENGHFKLVGSYAFHHRKENSNVFTPGQGLTGQAALEKKPIIFTQVPDDYIKINSGLGNTTPKNIIVYPFLYNETVKGLIEIGSVSEFSDLDMQFLNLVVENIGIAMNSSESRTKLKELLEETQRQAEELEAQQEEMKQVNEELLVKTQLLEKSESELKAQQEELQQTNEELEEKANLLEDQKGKLEVAKTEVDKKARELEVTSRYKSEFLANMSHELRTPLNSILILSQLLSENKNKSLNPKEIEFAQNIFCSGTDLLNLINEILDLSKVESGKIELDISEVKIGDVQDVLLSMFKEVAKNKSIDFEINFREEFNIPFTTDKQRLEQILKNLLSNAFKFTGKGGKVSVDASIMEPLPGLRNNSLRGLNEVVAFSVTDTGIGIPKSKQAAVFEAFQQADGSTRRKYGGTGLGLSISRELANALGGEIHVESEVDSGSIFTLYLPLNYSSTAVTHSQKEVTVKKTVTRNLHVQKAKPEETEKNTSDDRYHVQDSDKVILIIEDDQVFADFLLNFSRERGYKGIVAHQGNTGLSLARHYRPDAIILDMHMPVMDGSEVLKQLKHDPDLRHIPVQIISGFDKRKEGLELGAFDFIRKPIVKNDLNSAFGRIEEFINKKLKKLLIVEDNKQHNNAIRELIGNGDVKSYSAFTGEEAYDMMQKEKFDCLIIDLGLPDVTGLELLEKIKANDLLNKVPIIVYTGKELTKEEVTRLNRLANTVVLKTADSTERLLDETILFLHRVESKLPKEKQQIIRKLHRTDEVLVNKKVLIVDDDIRNIYSLTNVLEEEGLKCITAENGNAAIKILKEHPDTDIVLMDVMMPEMDGYEATQQIRTMNRFSKLPIIALTAKAMKGDREKCLETGMSDYIAKPVNIEQLLSLLRVWLYR